MEVCVAVSLVDVVGGVFSSAAARVWEVGAA
jgi:hypothetical protein